MKIAYIGNQGGAAVHDFYSGMARAMAGTDSGTEPVFGVWLDTEKAALEGQGWHASSVHSFAAWVRGRGQPDEAEIGRLRRDYGEVNWSEVVAAERAFTDYSMLLGAAGERREDAAYVLRLVANIATFIERILTEVGVRAMVCQTADTLFSLIAFRIAAHYRIPVYAICPAWLLEPGAAGGGFFVNNEFLESERMIEGGRRLGLRALDPDEVARADRLRAAITGFAGKTAFGAKNKGVRAGMTALSPNLRGLFGYLLANARRDRNVEYVKIDPWRKLRANLLRLWRKRATARWMGPKSTDAIPPRSVFFALHYQPEQSTLAQNIWQVNQVACVEDISKSLPLGYTLVVKEHPWGRGNRPLWQYRHMSRLYNVVFCDAPAKEIVRRVDAVVVGTGTIGIEAMALDKPVIALGRSFYTHGDLVYRADSARDLPEILKRILVDGDFAAQADRETRLRRFLLAYLDAMIPHFPTVENAGHYGRALAVELGIGAGKRRTA